MLTYFYPVFQDEISENALLANFGPLILKFFRASMPPDSLEGQNNSPRRFAAHKTFLGQALPPPPRAQNPSYGRAVFQTYLKIFATCEKPTELHVRYQL